MKRTFSTIIIFSLLLLCFTGFGQADADEDENNTYIFFDSLNKEELVVYPRKVPGNILDSLRRDDAYWYAHITPEKKEQKKNTAATRDSILNKKWFKTLMWVLVIIVFAGVVIAYLASSNIHLFRKSPKKVLQEETEGIPEDIFSINYDREIQKAIEANNYRLAVRLMYLQLLRNLSDKGIIQYTQGKTNADYLMQLFKSTYYKDFFRLTRNFEYTWYGKFDLSEQGFKLMQSDFNNFKSTLPR